MIILHLSDTHGLHHRIKDMPAADVIIQSHQVEHQGLVPVSSVWLYNPVESLSNVEKN